MGLPKYTPPQPPEPKQELELWTLEELIDNAKLMHDDATFKASKKVKDPRKRRHDEKMFHWTGSLLHYFTELQTSKQKEAT
jgi:hypothetical protein